MTVFMEEARERGEGAPSDVALLECLQGWESGAGEEGGGVGIRWLAVRGAKVREMERFARAEGL
jgi:hypothetical protein